MKNIKMVEINGVGWLAPDRVHLSDVLKIAVVSVAVAVFFYGVAFIAGVMR